MLRKTNKFDHIINKYILIDISCFYESMKKINIYLFFKQRQKCNVSQKARKNANKTSGCKRQVAGKKQANTAGRRSRRHMSSIFTAGCDAAAESGTSRRRARRWTSR